MALLVDIPDRFLQPCDENSIVLMATRDGRFRVRSSACPLAAPPEGWGDRISAIEAAMAQADRYGIPRVYLTNE
jgi:hypothetical protein